MSNYNWKITKERKVNAKQVAGKLLGTDRDIGSVIIRVFAGAVMFPHGAQKLLGWFGGYGFNGTMGFFTEQKGIPYILALLVIIAESFGALALITGLFTRVAAFGIGATMVVAAFMHAGNGFFMNWFGGQEGEGFEYHLLVIGMTLALIVKGAGRWSLDGWFTEKIKGE
jgi:putative oxidoreductase